MASSQADQLAERLANDAQLRQRIATAHRSVLDDAGIDHSELTDGQLAGIVGGLPIHIAAAAEVVEDLPSETL